MKPIEMTTAFATGPGNPSRLRVATVALAGTAGAQDIARRLLDRQLRVNGADSGVVALIDDTGTHLVLVASAGYDSDDLQAWQRFPLDADLPLTQAVRERETVLISSIEELLDRFDGVEAVGDRPHALAAFPLCAGEEVIGAVGLRFDVEDAATVTDEIVASSEALNDVAGEQLVERQTLDTLNERVQQLQTALDTRIVIEQAKGIVAERHRLDVDEAFERLRRHARSRGRKIHDVARDVIAGELKV